MSIWLDFRVDDDECDHQQDVYQGCPLCANDKLQAEIDKYKKLIDQIETACDYTNSAYNIQLLINDHKGE